MNANRSRPDREEQRMEESKVESDLIHVPEGNLFERVASILDQARGNVVRAVNSNMIIAYWLIGREIVHELQNGEERADYGKQVVEKLSQKLTEKYGKGFSTTNLWYFRQFYLTFADRQPAIRHKVCGESTEAEKLHKPCGVFEDLNLVVNDPDTVGGFSPDLSWSHYRALTKVEDQNARLFYEIEAEKQNWSVPNLERQINTQLFARLVKSKDKEGVMQLSTEGQRLRQPIDAIKNPYVLDFLDIGEHKEMHESTLEAAIMDKLQQFLLELGKGFAFVARQNRITTETDDFYIDLVFYNYLLKCFVLIDLKIGKLTHQDIGQLDMYVKMYDDLYRTKDDNPTVGLILCAERDEVIARYSVLNENEQIFASEYKLYLPTEEELERELAREREQIEERLGAQGTSTIEDSSGSPLDKEAGDGQD